jgi:hypothetical protein
MRVVSVDTETFLICPGVAAPRLVCGSYFDDDFEIGVELASPFMDRFRAWLADPEAVVLFHNAPFDLGVLCAEAYEQGDGEDFLRSVFRAIKDRRIRDTLIREKILENARGELKHDWDEDLSQYRRASFSLERVSWTRLHEFVKKTADTWRKRYGLLHGVPVSDWPEAATEYALKDSILCRRIFFAQEEAALVEGCAAHADGLADIPGETATTLAAFCLGLMRIWGVRTDPEATKIVRAEFTEKYNAVVKTATEAGLVKNGKRKMLPIRERVRACYQAHGADVPMSKKGLGKNIATDREALTFKRHTGWEKDEGLCAVADVVRYQKLLTTYVPILERGGVVPITPNWNAMVETFRVSCSDPNLTNQPRGTAVRNAFIPRPGYVYIESDYATLEMRTFAQVCIALFGYSVIADAFRDGKDTHLLMTANTLEISYESALARYEAGDKVIDNARQYSKIASYGFLGGMGPDAFIDYARGYDIEVERSHASKLRDDFKRTFTEVNDYFAYCSALCGDGGEAEVAVHPITGYVRGRVRYTALANNGFQHLAAVGAKAALCRAVEESYASPASALYGCRAVNFSHDSIMMEVPSDTERASAAADQLSRVMIEEMAVLCPDVPIKTDTVMMRRWYKGAKPTRLDGLLVPSRPEKTPDGRTIWVADMDEKRRAA